MRCMYRKHRPAAARIWQLRQVCFQVRIHARRHPEGSRSLWVPLCGCERRLLPRRRVIIIAGGSPPRRQRRRQARHDLLRKLAQAGGEQVQRLQQ